MACDPFESLLDRVFERSKPGDSLLKLDQPGEWELAVTRTATGISIYQLEWYPAMGSRDWTEVFDGDAARDKLRQSYGRTEDNDGRKQLEAKFPEFVDG